MTLRDANLVWSTDITYVPMPSGFMYLAAVIDWYSRYVIAWELSNTLDHLFCVSMLEEALCHAHPVIFNTDQGSQFTSIEFAQCLLNREILISMDGRGRALDNVFIERLWRSVKYEEVYLNDYQSVSQLYQGLGFHIYNHERPHSALEGRTPAQVHHASKKGDLVSALQPGSVWIGRECFRCSENSWMNSSELPKHIFITSLNTSTLPFLSSILISYQS
jgi:putative transposase